jgi:hypothetical protein
MAINDVLPTAFDKILRDIFAKENRFNNLFGRRMPANELFSFAASRIKASLTVFNPNKADEPIHYAAAMSYHAIVKSRVLALLTSRQSFSETAPASSRIAFCEAYSSSLTFPP